MMIASNGRPDPGVLIATLIGGALSAGGASTINQYYDRDMEDDSKKGVAEVIISKHRNGPTGDFKVAWMSRYAKFASLSHQPQ